MKRLFLIIVLIPLFLLVDCADKGKKANEGENKVELDTKSSINKDKETAIDKERKGIKIAPALLKEKIENGEAIQISLDDGPTPYGFKGDKIEALQLLDGKFYQVEKRDEKMWINVPHKGEMQIIRLSGKLYVFDDNDRAYEVKVVNNKLIAEATDLMDVLLADKK
jgi:hypothetical protein